MSAIIIGLGSTGLRIVEGVQQFYYQFTGTNGSSQLKYLFFETDLNAQPKNTPAGNQITSVPLPLTDMKAQIPALKSRNISNLWIPPVNTALAQGDGAGGQSAYGRLALWINWTTARQAIYQAWQAINGDNQTSIFIVGSLTGGTCSGAFIDMAYLVRHITGTDKIYGLFLVPGYSHVGIPGGNNILENYLIATSSLQALSVRDGSIVYDCTWPDGVHANQSVAPFELTYFLSTDYTNNKAPLGSIQDLCKVAAFNIFFRVLDIQQQSVYSAFLLNIKTPLPNYQYSTFNNILIHYPEAQLKEYIALEICNKEVLSKWIDSEIWFDKNNQKQSVTGQRDVINSRFSKDFEQKLTESLNCIDGLQVVGAPTIFHAIRRDVSKIKTDKSFNILNAFSSSNDLNHYTFVANNCHFIKQRLIDGIYELLAQYMEDYQNLFIIKNILYNHPNNPHSLQQTIQNILNFWHTRYNIDGDIKTFNNTLTKAVNNIKRNKQLPSVVLQTEKYLEEQLCNLYMLCKLHFTVPILKLICEALDNNNVQLHGETHILPNQNSIDVAIDKIRKVISKPDASATISARMAELNREMDSSAHFRSIFNQNKESDIQGLWSKYQNLPPLDRFTSQQLDNGHSFDYIINPNNNEIAIYNDCVEKGIAFVQSKNLVSTQNITTLLANLARRQPVDNQYQIIQQFFEGSEPNIRAQLPGLIGLCSNSQSAVQFQPHQNLKLLYSTIQVDNLKAAFQKAAPQSYLQTVSSAAQSGVDIPEFCNAIMIYQEYGFMANNDVFNPLTDIIINSPIKRYVQAILEKGDIGARCPYIDAATLQQQINQIPD